MILRAGVSSFQEFLYIFYVLHSTRSTKNSSWGTQIRQLLTTIYRYRIYRNGICGKIYMRFYQEKWNETSCQMNTLFVHAFLHLCPSTLRLLQIHNKIKSVPLSTWQFWSQKKGTSSAFGHADNPNQSQSSFS